MRALIIIKEKQTASALQRYFRFLHNTDTDIIEFSPLKENGTSPFMKFDFVISEIYDENGTNFGLQFGSIFEAVNKNLVYFFSLNNFHNAYDVRDLPENCFYLPLQLNEFLKSFGKPKTTSPTSEKIMTSLKSRTVTSSHH